MYIFTAEMRPSQYINVDWVMIVQIRVSNVSLIENEAGQWDAEVSMTFFR